MIRINRTVHKANTKRYDIYLFMISFTLYSHAHPFISHPLWLPLNIYVVQQIGFSHFDSYLCFVAALIRIVFRFNSTRMDFHIRPYLDYSEILNFSSIHSVYPLIIEEIIRSAAICLFYSVNIHTCIQLSIVSNYCLFTLC